MIVQTINTFPVGNNLTAADLVLLTPGGGTGDTTAGCRSQYGTVWYVTFSFAPDFGPSHMDVDADCVS